MFQDIYQSHKKSLVDISNTQTLTVLSHQHEPVPTNQQQMSLISVTTNQNVSILDNLATRKSSHRFSLQTAISITSLYYK